MEGEEKNNYGFRESMPPRRRLKTICAVSAFFFARSFLNSHTSTRFCIHFEFWLCPKEKQKKIHFAQIIEPIWPDFFSGVLDIASSQRYAQNRPHIQSPLRAHTRDKKNNLRSHPKSNQRTVATVKMAWPKDQNEMVKCVEYSNARARTEWQRTGEHSLNVND